MSVKSSATVFHALRQLAVAPRPLSAAELARMLTVPVTTAARALNTLEAAGYAERHQGSPPLRHRHLGPHPRVCVHGAVPRPRPRDALSPAVDTGDRAHIVPVRSSGLVRRSDRSDLWRHGPDPPHEPRGGGAADNGAPSLAILAYLPGEDFERALAVSGVPTDSGALLDICGVIRGQGLSTAASLVRDGPLRYCRASCSTIGESRGCVHCDRRRAGTRPCRELRSIRQRGASRHERPCGDKIRGESERSS